MPELRRADPSLAFERHELLLSSLLLHPMLERHSSLRGPEVGLGAEVPRALGRDLNHPPRLPLRRSVRPRASSQMRPLWKGDGGPARPGDAAPRSQHDRRRRRLRLHRPWKALSGAHSRIGGSGAPPRIDGEPASGRPSSSSPVAWSLFPGPPGLYRRPGWLARPAKRHTLSTLPPADSLSARGRIPSARSDAPSRSSPRRGRAGAAARRVRRADSRGRRQPGLDGERPMRGIFHGRAGRVNPCLFPCRRGRGIFLTKSNKL